MKKDLSVMRRCQKNAHFRKIWMTMKLMMVLFLVAITNLIASEAYSQNTKLTMQITDATVKEVLSQIETNSEFFFLYNSKLVDVDRKVSMDVNDQKINEILSDLFGETDVVYAVVDRQIVLTNKANHISFLQPGSQQPQKVTGTVTDKDGLPLPGVNVVVTGTTRGTITDIAGKYSIEVPPGSKSLTFTFVGMDPQEIEIGSSTLISVTMSESAIGLEEVVVVGYGTSKKSDLTASIASISMEDISESASLSINNMIQGRVPGVDIVSSSGMPGAGVSIKIRGVSSINNSEPLYVIDGVQFFNDGGESFSVMSMINPQDIERIEILKDASAAAIYGANGANGVILITTKKGKKGRAKVTFKAQYGVAQTPRKLDILEADEYVDLLVESQLNYYPNSPISEVVGPTVLDYGYSRVDRTDWQDEVFKNANLYQADMSVSGGGENANYLFSFGYSDQEAIVIENDLKRYTIRMASDFKLAEKITIGENMNLMYTTRNTGGSSGLITDALRIAPYVPVYDKNNYWGFGNNNNVNDNNNASNPCASVYYTSNQNTDVRLFGNIYGTVDFTDWLKYYVSLGINFNNHYNNNFTKTHTNGNLIIPMGLEERYAWGLSPLLEQTLTFDKTFGNHAVTILGGMSVSRYGGGRSITVIGKNFPNEELDNIMLAGDNTIADAAIWKGAGLSYFARANYGFANKYLLTAIFRADASPNFAPQNRWGKFPAVSAAWKLQEESFIKDNFSVISNLKLRLGWGKNGISNIDSYQYLSFMHSRGMSYPVGLPGTEQYMTGTTIKALASPDIQWEEATTKNIGLDVGLLNNSLTFTVDYFDKLTDNILVTVPTSPSMGLGLAGGSEGGSRIANAASVTNKGLEFSATYSNYKNEFKYNVSGNITYVTNEVTGLGAGEPIQGPQYNGQAAISLTGIGQPIGSFYGFMVDKVYANQSEVDADNATAQAEGVEYYQSNATQPGDIRFKDLDGNGYIDGDDRDYIGSPIPKYTFGLAFDASYKGWDFATSLTGIADVDIYSAFYTWSMEGMRLTSNHSTYVRDRWTPTNTDTNVPRAISADPSNNLRTSDRYINDGSYMKLRNLSIGYTLPESVLNSMNLSAISKLRVYANVQNLLTITSYKKGLDPEVAAIDVEEGDMNGYNLGRGIDDGFVPHPRTYMFGVEIVF